MGRNKRNGGDSEMNELRGEVKRLRKQLKQAQRHHRLIDEYDPNEIIEPVTDVATRDFSKCPGCGEKNTVKQVDIGIKIIEACSECDYRKVINNG